MTRTVIVGDVHGCAAELSDLLDRVGLSDADQLVFVGDLIARGPDSRGVLEIVRRTRARSVVGNHELKLLRAGAGHAETFAELEDEDWALLAALPYYLDLEQHGIRVIHAGVVPGIAIDEQDPWVLTHIRSIDPDGSASSKLRPPSWASLYTGPPHVVFGHNALVGLQFHPWATGLDTACVYGGALSALVLDAGAKVPPMAERHRAIVSVPARRKHYVP